MVLNSLYWLGIACLTYFVSRGVLFGLRDQVRGSLGWLVVTHCVSGLFLFVTVFFLRGGIAADAFPYLPMQAIWLGFDWLRTMKMPSKSARRRTRVPTRLVGRVVAVLMGLTLIVYAAGTFLSFSYMSTSYADIPIDGMQQDALYAVGAPDQVRNGPDNKFVVGDPRQNRDWRYLSPSMVIQFDGDTQRVSSILCEAPTLPTQSSCPWSLLAVGDTELDLTGKLGRPTFIQVNGGVKIARYPEIGHDFMLERFRIKSIRVYPDNSNRLSKLWRLIIYAIP